MKKQKAIFAVLAVLFAATACQKEFSFQDESVVEEPVPAEFTIEASVDVNDTRAFLDETGDIFWNEGDALAVFQGSNAEPYLFVTEEEGLSCSFTYQGELKAEDGDFLALYPYNAEARQSSTGVITTVLPSEQTAAAGTFGKDANLAVAYAPFRQPMSFKNAAAYAKVSFKTTDQNAAVTKITIRSVDESILLAGTVTLTPTILDDAVTDVTTVVTDGVPYASVVAPAGTTLAPDTDYYIVVAPAALTSGYRIEFTTSDGFTFSKDYTGTTYNAATFKRNNIAPVGKKNLDKFETPLEGYWRLTSQEEFGEGSYLFGYPMGDGNIRIFDESKTDCFMSDGSTLVTKFYGGMDFMSLLQLKIYWNSWQAGGESPTLMRHYVMWAFRNAYVDTDSGASVTGFSYVGDDLILNPNDKFRLPVDADNTLSMKLGYKSGGQQYKNVQLSGCSLTLDGNNGVTIKGRVTEESIENLIDIFYIGKGGNFLTAAPQEAALEGAKKACGKDTTVGFCTVEQTIYAGDKMNNMYMIQNYHLCSSPTPSAIWLYKKGVKAVSYLKYKEINN